MSRSYTLKKRAEQQAETRRRIVEAAVELHSRLGPARTPVSMIADRAGVQRKTFYAHFPDDRSLHLACSGLALERDPPPDAAEFAILAEPNERLRSGLQALYDWYARNAEMVANVLRDAEYHSLTKQMVDLRFGPPLARIVEVLSDGLDNDQRAILLVAVDFHCWHTLVRTAALERTEAAQLMTKAIARTA